MRCTSVPVLAAATVLTLRARRNRGEAAGRMSLYLIAGMAVIGLFDVGANLLFGLATVSGALPVVAVLGSLYPAATVLLARVVDNERMSRLQDAGVAAAITGVAMIAGGS